MSKSAKAFFDRLRREDPEYREAWEEIEDDVVLAKNIVRMRRERGLTQKDLAKKAGMRQPRIAELETGEANPTTVTLKRVARALGVRTGRLFELEQTAIVHKQYYVYFEAQQSPEVGVYPDPVLQRASGYRDSLTTDWGELEEWFK